MVSHTHNDLVLGPLHVSYCDGFSFHLSRTQRSLKQNGMFRQIIRRQLINDKNDGKLQSS